MTRMTKRVSVIVLVFVSLCFFLPLMAQGETEYGPRELSVNWTRSHLSFHTFKAEAGEGELVITKNATPSRFYRGVIYFNGKFVSLRTFLKSDKAVFEKKVHLRKRNRMVVFFRGKRGASLKIEVRGDDTLNPPAIDFVVNPTIIDVGETSHLTWSTVGADAVIIDNGVGLVDLNGSIEIQPLQNTEYTLSATGPGGTASATAAIEVRIPPPTATLNVAPKTITLGNSAVLSWDTTHANSCVIEPGIGTVDCIGSTNIDPTETTLYTLTATGPSGSVVESKTVTVQDLLPAVSISATRAEINLGESTQINWDSTEVGSLYIDNQIGKVETEGSIQVTPDVTTTYTISGTGPQGTVSSTTTVVVLGSPETQPEGSFGERYNDLIPTDATVESYDVKRFSLITGQITTIYNDPLMAVSITIFNHPEYGTVKTDDKGHFTIPVDGGGLIKLIYKKQGYITSHRQVNVPWNDHAVVETIQMITEDPVSTTLTFDGNADTIITHTSTPITDESGTRSLSMVFQGDNQAFLVDEDGNDIQELATITTRASEYTTPESMPAVLPPTSAFTYCAELSVDGAKRVRFAKPVIIWVDNFLGFDVSEIVPVGYYDRDEGVWKPSDNGVVVKLLDTNGDGIVDALDSTGDGAPDDLDGDGSFANEVTGLDDSTRYVPGTSYWRTAISHFTPWDCNWPWGPPPDATDSDPNGPPDPDQDDPPCFIKGTLVKTDNGLKPIEQIVQGDLVYSRDEKTDTTLLRKVTKTFVTQNQIVYELTFTNQDTPIEAIGATGEHPFWTKNNGWVATKDLRPGDKVATFDKKWIVLSSSKQLPDRQTVYNIEVEGFHTYFVTGNNIWVHNACSKNINPKRRTIDYDIPIPGTDITFHYSSNRVQGRKNVITVPASGDTVPDSLKRIIVKMTVAGRTFEQTLEPLPNQTAEFIWDGLDNLGRSVNRTTKASINIGFVYDLFYYSSSSNFGQAFGQVGENMTAVRGRQEMTSWKNSVIIINPLAQIIAEGGGLLADGWTLSNHHYLTVYPMPLLHKGDGTTSKDRYGSGRITTVAGNNAVGYSGDGGPAIYATITWPHDIFVDSAGNLYIADSHNNRIRKVDTNGIITTVAGNDGTFGYIGDEGPATDTGLNRPDDIFVDSAGNLYIADTYNNRIRKVDTNGIITTVAGNGTVGYSGDGGPATDTGLYRPNGIFVDSAGNLYIADTYNNRIRKVDTNGIITTAAGNGTESYSGDGGPATDTGLARPNGIFVDSAGNLYIADMYNDRIRKVDTNGIITTVAGNGTEGYFGDGGPATDTGLYRPSDIFVDSAENLYIADSYSNRIRKVDTNGIITIVSGNGTFSYSGDRGPATDAGLYRPNGIFVDSAGNLYIADTFNNRIRKVELGPPYDATSDEISFPEESGLGHIMSNVGLHKKSIDLDTGVTLREFGYDKDNNLISIIDQFGNQLTINRDGVGTPTSITSPDGITTTLTIDADNHLDQITYEDGSAYNFEYSSDSLLTAVSEPEGNQFEHTFDSKGRLTDASNQEDGYWNFTRTVQDNGDILTEVLSAEGDQTNYRDYTDSTGAYESTTTDPTGAQTLFTRSADELTAVKSDTCGMDLGFAYDLDSEYEYRYAKEVREKSPSSLEKVVQREKSYQDTNADEIPDLITETVTINGKRTTFVNNTLLSTKTLTSPVGRTVTATYDPTTLVTTNVAVLGLYPDDYEYDNQGRLLTAQVNTRRTDFTYNGKGFLESVTDPTGYTTSYGYDDVGRVISMERPDSSTLGFSYDKNGNMTVLTNPALTDHGFSYNTTNANDSYITPLSGSYSYVYDRDKRLSQVNFPSGYQINSIYTDGNLKQIQTPERDIDVTYLCGSKINSITMGIEAMTYGYDGTLVTSETSTGTLNQPLAYSYNNNFNLSSFTYAGSTESYTYDDDALLTGAGDFTITRNSDNGLPESVADGTLNLKRTFNGYGEISSETRSVNSTDISSWSTVRNNAGRITSKSETVDGVTSNYVYIFDSMGSLVTVSKDSTVVEEYRYDLNGTRTYEMNTARGISGRTFSYSDEDHLLTAGTTEYNYDLDGFLTTKTNGADVSTYKYSSRGELLNVTLPDGKQIEYLHDPFGRRVAKKVNGTITEKYLWQGLTRLLAVYDGSDDSLLIRFNYADSRMPLAMEKAGNTYYLSYNQVGSLTLVADEVGNVIKKITYDSFGNIINDSNSTFYVPFGFAGGLHDKDTGLVRFGYRDYDPEIGRWTAKDPIFFAGGTTDLYGYVGNDPINWVDPWGLESLPSTRKVPGNKPVAITVLKTFKAINTLSPVPLEFIARDQLVRNASKGIPFIGTVLGELFSPSPAGKGSDVLPSDWDRDRNGIPDLIEPLPQRSDC